MLYRLYIMMLNLIFPPFAVLLMRGINSYETILNACLFLLAIVPSHIHGFLVSWHYFREEDQKKREERQRRERRRQRGGSDASSSPSSRSRSRSRSARRSSRMRYKDYEIDEYESDSWHEQPRQQRYIDQGRPYPAILPPVPEPPPANQHCH